MVFLLPAAGAFVGTAWGVSHPTQRIHGGLVVSQASFWGVLLSTLVGAVAGVVILTALIWCFQWFRYRHLGGDSDWKVVYEGALDNLMFFELHCRADVPIEVGTLGACACRAKAPNGAIVDAERFGPRHSPLGLTAHFLMAPEPGNYDVRWYATRGSPKMQEVARYRGPASTASMPSTLKPVF